VPDTLGDAVLSRVRHLARLTRDVVSAASVIGRSFDFDLLTVVTGDGPDEVAGALRELQDAYLVLPGADEVTFDFRHALIRDTRGTWPGQRRPTGLGVWVPPSADGTSGTLTLWPTLGRRLPDMSAHECRRVGAGHGSVSSRFVPWLVVR
jgi:hypothetical protein